MECTIHFDSCKICSFQSSIKDRLDHAFEKHYQLHEYELHKLLFDILEHETTILKTNNCPVANITLDDVKYHYSECKVSKKNTLIRDIRKINQLQKNLGHTNTDISLWLNLNKHKTSLINQLKQDSVDVNIEPIAFD